MHDQQQEKHIRHVRKGSLYSFIAFLSISALVAITSVLSGSFGEFEVKVLVTTSAIAIASICSLCCSAYTGRTHHRIPGIAGMTLAGISGGLLILGVWVQSDSEGYWKTTAILGLFALSSAHALALRSIRLRPGHNWLQNTATINILGVALITSIMILGEIDEEGMFKLLAVSAILAALETLVIPIMGILTRAAPSPAVRTLSLVACPDGTYEDKEGRRYHVSDIPTPPEPTSVQNPSEG